MGDVDSIVNEYGQGVDKLDNEITIMVKKITYLWK